ncbi:MAG TPA: histidinol dehydrogenase [bacterium]|nr:histidinol dehydrogenase [Dictyoglomota bacterium]HOK29570.1 histidinol dehydrogenase [bacterium]HOL54599.1 histidinol dehydrogenase [bacterium]HOP55485.1 histidinol dehydrogenase [bacterium]HRR90846.1 histidinol dehydrogenase [bacterium]
MKNRIIRDRKDLSNLVLERKKASDVKIAVEEILERVKEAGDVALIKYSNEFDKANFSSPKDFVVSKEEIEESIDVVGEEFISAVNMAIKNIRDFYSRMPRPQNWFYLKNGKLSGQMVVPLESVGIYVPGGRAPYPSTVMMAAIPAQIAGVKRIVVTTPKPVPEVLAVCKLLDIYEVYRLGGAHAIAGLAYGTDTITRVDKIVGPGNRFVVSAKKYVFGETGIEMIPGPSEIVVLADSNANPKFVAIDLLSQAEHDPLAMSILVTDSEDLANRVIEEMGILIRELSTCETAKESWESWGGIVLVNSIDEGIDTVNFIAPEHLELQIKNPASYLEKIRNAGTIFIGEKTPEAIGDYIAGSSHILPTGGSARFSSGLNVLDFLKLINITQYNEITEDFKSGSIIADREGFSAHKKSLEIRDR